MRLLLNTIIFSGFIFLCACSSPKIIKIDNSLPPSEESATIKRGFTNIWYVLGFCGTDAHVVAADGNVLPQFTEEKIRLGLPYNPEFDYVVEVPPGEHEFTVALQSCHLIAYQLAGCYLERIGSCNVIVESNHNYAVKGFGCSPEKGVNFIDLENNKVIKECKKFIDASSPWIHESLGDFLKNETDM